MNEILTIGGPILWLLLLFGILAVVLFLERTLQMHRDRIDVKDFLNGIYNALQRGNETEALALCEETPGPVARLSSLAIRRRTLPSERLDGELADAAALERVRSVRRIAFLRVFSRIAPLCGLLGTVIGLVRALLSYRAAYPLCDATELTNALLYGAVTSAAGLLVAIPCLAGHAILTAKAERMDLDMRVARSELVRFFMEGTHVL